MASPEVEGAGGGVDGLGLVGSIEVVVEELSFGATAAAGAEGVKAGSIRPEEVMGGTTFIAGGVLETVVASRSCVPGRMMRLDRLAGTVGGAMDAGVDVAGGRMVGDVDETDVTGAGVEALPGTGGWKRRADLRKSGSTGGVMALDFRSGSDWLEASAGGTVMEADLRMIGSTGGTIGVDFLTASGVAGIGGAEGVDEIGVGAGAVAIGAGVMGGGVEGLTGVVAATAETGVSGGGGVMAAVLEAGTSGGGIDGLTTGASVGPVEAGVSGVGDVAAAVLEGGTIA